MTSEIQFFFFIIGGGVFFSGIMLLLINRIAPGVLRGGNYWASGNLVLFLGFLLVGLENHWPAFITLVISNTLLISTGAFFYIAISHVAQKEYRKKLVFSMLGFTFASQIYFVLIQFNYSARILILFTMALLFCILSMKQLSKMKEPELIGPVRITSLLFAGLIILCLMRIVQELLYYYPQNSILSPSSSIILTITVTSVFVGITLLTTAFILLSNASNYLGIQQLAYEDSLTKTFSRRAIMEKLKSEISAATRSGMPFTTILIDFDKLKFVNDRFGHLAGDEALKKIAKTIKESLRTEDVIGRFGGDEFIILLSSTNQKGAEFTIQRIFKNINALEYSFDHQVRVSVGGVQFTTGIKNSDELIAQADKNLYIIKAAGGNDYRIS